ncbi:MAG TPA: sialidase family protein [Thermoanaerobaculia bacterium]
MTARLPDGFLIARVPGTFDGSGLQAASAADENDPASARMVRVFRRSQAVVRSAPRGNGLPWDAPGFEPPHCAEESAEVRKLFKTQLSSGTPTSLIMTGHVAVGLVIVGGPSQYDLQFDDDEIDTITVQVVSGADFLAGANPEAGLTFDIERNIVDVTAAPPASCPTYEQCEAVWRDPALAQLGYSPNRAGSVQYAEALQDQPGIDWGYVAYVTKYPLGHSAYSSGERLVISYDNDGWGSGNIHRTFAHESGHIFGAQDEYGDSNCTCNSTHGYLNAPNGNCVNCPGEHLKCLMDHNDLQICSYSRRQIGWNAWSAQTDITSQNDAESSDAPSLAVYGGKLWMAYLGSGSSNNLWAAAFDGSTWGGQTEITDQNDAESSYAPGLAAYGGKLWIAYRGSNSSKLYASAYDGSSWGDQTKVTDENDAETSRTPSLVEFQGKLWMVYRGKHEDLSDLWACSFDGSNWSAQTNITDSNSATTSESPGLAVYGGKLWVVYRGSDSSNIWCCSFDGTTWSAQTEITTINGAKTSAAPRIGVLGDHLWMVYRGESSDNIWSCAFDGTTWLAQTEVTTENGAQTSAALGLAPYNGLLYSAYRGEGSSSLWSAALQPQAVVR